MVEIYFIFFTDYFEFAWRNVCILPKYVVEMVHSEESLVSFPKQTF